MKTKFFKKLSFVLALAMVLSIFAPAAGAFAAKAPKLNSTKKYLHLDVDGKNEFNFNISNKGKGWKYFWESANEDVAVVNEKNGVTTATGAGKTKVQVTITDADDEEVDVLSATVTVRDNIETVKISNPVETLSVGEEHDYNRSYVTVAGNTKGSESVTRWTVEPAEGATIDNKGVFVATEAGEYTVTANSFQSKARYKAWLKDAEANTDEVLATDTTKVVVAGSMVDAKQVDEDTVKVIFDTEVEDVEKNLTLYQLVGTTKVKQLVKEVKLAEDKKSADVTVYIPFTQEADFVVEYTGMDDISFKAARMKAEDVTYIKVDTSKAVYGESTEIKVKLFNADGVDVTAGEGLSNRVTMEAEEVAGTFFDGKNLMIFDENKAVKITATYHTYEWDSTSGEELGNLQAVGVVIGVDADATNITGLDAWTIVKQNNDTTYSPDFNNVKQLIAAEDVDFRLFVKFNTKTGSDTDSVNSDDNEPDFEFESSNDEVMIVGSNGELYPNKQGVVTVIVKYGKDTATKTPVGAVQITVGPKAKASNLVLGSYSASVSNKIADSKDVSLKLTDQSGRDVEFDSSDVAVEITNGPATIEFWDVAADGKKITFNGQLSDGQEVEKGRYSIKITVKDVTRYITVNVITSDADTVSKYVLELGNNKVDLKAEDKKVNKSISIKLFGLASNGTKIEEPTFDGENFKLVVDAPYVSGAEWDYKNEYGATNNNTSVTIDDREISLYEGTDYTLAQATSGTSIAKAPTGSYKVTAYEYKNVGTEETPNMKWVIVDSKSFVVEDTQTKPVVSKVKTLVYDEVDSTLHDDVVGVVADCFEVKLDGNELAITDAEYNGTNASLYIKSVTVRKEFTINDSEEKGFIDFKVNVGRTIKQK